MPFGRYVGNLLGQVGGSHLNCIRDHDGHPDRDRAAARQAASGSALKIYATSSDINLASVIPPGSDKNRANGFRS
jgi:hypothetical protein